MDPNEQKYIEQFDRLNVNAAAFVPNASAQPFVPYGYNPQGYGEGACDGQLGCKGRDGDSQRDQCHD